MCLRGDRHFPSCSRMGVFREWACFENGHVSKMGVSREWACLENGRVSRVGVSREWACLESGRVSRMGVSREWACLESGRVSRVGVSREWAQCVQNHCFCKVFQNRCAQNHCFCKVLCKRGLKNHCFCKVFHKHFRRGWWSNRRNYFAYGAQPPSPSHLLVQRQWPAVAHHIGTHRIPIYISIHRASERAPLNISI